jgi:hypothetical protein
MSEEQTLRDTVRRMTAEGWEVVSESSLGIQMRGPKPTRFFTALCAFLILPVGLGALIFGGVFLAIIAAGFFLLVAILNHALTARDVKFLERAPTASAAAGAR